MAQLASEMEANKAFIYHCCKLHEQGEYIVKEVSYMVGISDTKYFAKCFRAKYGLSPLEYKNKQKE